MKLSELLKLKNAIDDVWNPHNDRQLIENTLMPVYSLISNAAFYTNLYPNLEERRQQWDKSLDSYQDIVRQIKGELNDLIKSHWPDFLKTSESNFEAGHDALIEPDLDQEAVDYVQSRVRLLGDWRKPGLIIRPGTGNLIQHWVGFDPLYLADTHESLMEVCVQQFPPLYQGRLRKYVIKEPGQFAQTVTNLETLLTNESPKIEEAPEETPSQPSSRMYANFRGPNLLPQFILRKQTQAIAAVDTTLLLGNLPQQQFDSCLVYNFFHYKKPSVIQLYLKSIFKVLAPGGRLLCTINDCDRWAGAINAEQGSQTFSPLSWFVESSRQQGFELHLHHYLSSSTTWVELTKPGYIEPLKAGQTLARIYNKPPDQVNKTLDGDQNTQYNISDIEIDNLIETAVNLNIDTAYNCRHNYTPQQLYKLIKRRMKQT